MATGFTLLHLASVRAFMNDAKKTQCLQGFYRFYWGFEMEPVVGIEPTTHALRKRCSTTELNWPERHANYLPKFRQIKSKSGARRRVQFTVSASDELSNPYIASREGNDRQPRSP